MDANQAALPKRLQDATQGTEYGRYTLRTIDRSVSYVAIATGIAFLAASLASGCALARSTAERSSRLSLDPARRQSTAELKLEHVPSWASPSTHVYPLDLILNGVFDTYVFDRNRNRYIDLDELLADLDEDHILEGLHPEEDYILAMGPANYAIRLKQLRDIRDGLRELNKRP